VASINRQALSRGEQNRHRLQGDGEGLRVPREAQLTVLLRVSVRRNERGEGGAVQVDPRLTMGSRRQRVNAHGLSALDFSA